MNNNTEYEVAVKNENVADNMPSEVMSFDSFEEIEDIVTASSKGTVVCCF